MTPEQVNPFEYKKPSEENVQKIQDVRDAFKGIYDLLITLRSSREMSIAITKLEESAMWATKSLVFNQQ